MFSICFYDMDQNMDHEVVAEEVLDCIALSPVVVWERNKYVITIYFYSLEIIILPNKI